MAKQLSFSEEARTRIKAGVDTIVKTIAVTLGPKGRNVLIDRKFGGPQITKDGVSVAKEIELADDYENLGAKLIREASEKTSDSVGDGTTTTAVLARTILTEGLQMVVAGANPMALKRGIDQAAQVAIEAVRKLSKAVKDDHDIKAVASVSANNDSEIGSLMADAVRAVGKEGVITVEESKSMKSTLEISQGMLFDRGYLSNQFVTDTSRMETVLKNALVLIYEKKISSAPAFVPFLERVSQAGKPLLVIAEDVEGEALAVLVVNKMRGLLQVAAVKAPGYGDRRKEILQDIAVLTNGTFISDELGLKLEDIQIDQLGKAESITIDKDNTTISGGAGVKAKIEERVQQIRKQIEKAASSYDKEKLQERLAKLVGGVATIKVGAATEAEMKEKKARVQDAVHATRAAIEEGIVPGGGVALLRAQKAVREMKLSGDEKVGSEIVARALKGPICQIAQNAGFSGDVVMNRVLEESGNFGFNAETGEYGDLVKADIIDPTKVVRTAIQNASSIASMILTTEVTICDKPEEEKKDKKTGCKKTSKTCNCCKH